jgi:hypothetical protein
MRTCLSCVTVLCAAALVSSTAARERRACCAVLELRQYTLKPGQRDTLVTLFDRHFVESQEALGMMIVGQFRDRARPDRFVWIRGFSDMRGRLAGLESFYTGPVWAEHKAAANQTMVDVSDVYLLKPARPDTSFRLDWSNRPPVGEVRKGSTVLAGIQRLQRPADAAVVSDFEKQAVPQLLRAGVNVISIFVTESSPNNFPRLPVREGEHVLVWFGISTRGEKAGADASPPFDLLELEPTPRSLLGH